MNKLRTLREQAKLTQSEIAKKVGVTQPHYHRWEKGEVPVPERQLAKLAKLLKTTPEAITGPKLKLIEPRAKAKDEDVEKEIKTFFDRYWGEVSFHFCGSGKPLVVSIGQSEMKRLFRDLQDDKHFHVFETPLNQLVVIRRKALADVYVSDDAVDTFGPEHEEEDRYDHDYVGLSPFKEQHWPIVEKVLYDYDESEDLTAFDPKDVEHVLSIMRPPKDEKPEEEGSEKETPEEAAKFAKQQRDFLENLTGEITYQLSNGRKRQIKVPYDDAHLYSGTMNLYGPFEDGNDEEDEITVLRLEGGYQTAFIRPSQVDYMIVPAHKWRKGMEDIDKEEDEAAE